ncbi:MAG: hypothetical protein ISR90_07020 [Candidatus Marinimicrobia bacterium]|nr:hypothetical protein [Candidatus Neomarinimicrobiota bacterium]
MWQDKVVENQNKPGRTYETIVDDLNCNIIYALEEVDDTRRYELLNRMYEILKQHSGFNDGEEHF